MPFTIKVLSESSSNKHKILCHKADLKPAQQPSGVTAPIPFIDRLTVTLTVPTKEVGKDMWNAYFTSVNDEGIIKTGACSRGYNRGHKLCLDSVLDSKKWPHYEVAWEDKCITRARLDFVPADLGYDGMVDLHAVLTGFMDSGWAYLVEHGRITRLDVALDFPHVSMDEFHFLPAQGATSSSWSHSGKLQTYQSGKSNGNCTSIYDRGAKRKAQGKGWQGKVGVRVERRLRNPAIKLHELPTMANPFASMCMVKKVAEPPSATKQTYIWSLFMDAAETIGLATALAKLPVKKRTAFRKHLANHLQPWWDAETSWSEWPTMLSDLKIANPNAWY